MAKETQQETGVPMFAEVTPGETDGWVLPFPENYH